MFVSCLLSFISALLLSVVLTLLVRNVARTCGWVEVPQLDRHVHTFPVPRLGGVGICGAFIIVVIAGLFAPRWMGPVSLLQARTTLSLLGPAFIVFLLGLYDDFKPVNPHMKFGIQAVAAALLYWGGFGIHEVSFVSGGYEVRSVIGFLLTVFWILLITNAFNLIDGLDGLAAGSALFSTLVVFVTLLVSHNFLLTFLAITLAGAILGFLRFNFYPATIFLGDSGSLFIGFMLGELALAGSQKAPTMVAVAVPIVSLGLPILDVALAVMRRFVRQKPLFTGDGDHIHHKLLKRGYSQRDAVLVLYAATAGFGFMSLVLFRERRVIALVLAVAAIGIFMGVQQLRYQEFTELVSALHRIRRRRQMLANHVAIRHATESLNSCSEFSPICEILQNALKPIGFDGVRFQMLGPNGFPASALHPLRHTSDGKLLHWWSDRESHEAPWELRLELVTSSLRRWGYVSLIRMRGQDELQLDVNVLMTDFRTSLSDAMDRAVIQMEAHADDMAGRGGAGPRKSRASSMAN